MECRTTSRRSGASARMHIAASATSQRRGRDQLIMRRPHVNDVCTISNKDHQLWPVSRVSSNQKQMLCPVSSYLVCTSNQQRCVHSRISQFATSAMWQRRGRNRADNAWLDVGRALGLIVNISCSQSVASRLIRNRCHVLSVLINNDAAGVAPRGRTHACISLRQQYDSAAGDIELIRRRR